MGFSAVSAAFALSLSLAAGTMGRSPAPPALPVSGVFVKLDPSALAKLSVISQRVPRAWEAIGRHLSSVEGDPEDRAALLTRDFLGTVSEEDLRAMPPGELHDFGERLFARLTGEQPGGAESAPEPIVDLDIQAFDSIAPYWRAYREYHKPGILQEDRERLGGELNTMRGGLAVLNPVYSALLPRDVERFDTLENHYRGRAALANPVGPWNARLLAVMARSLEHPRLRAELLEQGTAPADLEAVLVEASGREAKAAQEYLSGNVHGRAMAAWLEGRPSGPEREALANHYLKLKRHVGDAQMGRVIAHWLVEGAPEDGLPTMAELAHSLEPRRTALLERLRKLHAFCGLLQLLGILSFLSAFWLHALAIIAGFGFIVVEIIPRWFLARNYYEFRQVHGLRKRLLGLEPGEAPPKFRPQDWS